MSVERSLIAQLPLFSNLGEEVLEVIAAKAQAKRFAALQQVLSHHTTPAYLILVLRGQLQKTEVSEDGRITSIDFVNPGQVVDWVSVIDDAPIIFSVSTTQQTDLLLLPTVKARELLQTNNDIASTVHRQLAQDVRRVTEQRQLLSLPNAYQRVFVQIIHLAEQSKLQGTANLPKQHEIAAMVNTSRETVSRAIQMLVKNGILLKNGHRFLIQGTDQLRRLAAMSQTSTSTNKTE